MSELQQTNQAVGRLFREHGDLIYSLGLRICGTEEAAEDLVQETFLRALRSWGTFEGRSKASTWLYTIATRACARMRRPRAGQPRTMEPLEQLLPTGEVRLVPLPADDDPEATVARREAVDAILVATAQLPMHFRLPFVLKEMTGLSLAEISSVLGVPEATIKTRLHRARLRVRKAAAAALPSLDTPPPSREREECLALLRAKQEAMDRDVAFPFPATHLCEQCRSVFQSLEFGRDVCLSLGRGEMPDELRQALKSALTDG